MTVSRTAGLVVAVALELILSPGARAQAPASATLPVLSLGDTWTYKRRFVTVDCAQWTVSALDQGGKLVMKCEDDLAYFNRESGGIERITGPGGKKLVEFTPYQPGLQFPLTVGKTWTAKYAGYTGYNGYSYDSVDSCKVTGYEQVKVPAGTFGAFKVECDDKYQMGVFGGVAHTQTWYSPQAKTAVMVRSSQDDHFNMDLVSYTVH